MLCSKRISQQKDTNQRNKYSRDDNNKNDKESQPKTNQCPECGILLKNEKDSKYTAPQKTDDSKIIRPPLDCDLVNQTVYVILVKEDISALLSKAPKMIENIRSNSH